VSAFRQACVNKPTQSVIAASIKRAPPDSQKFDDILNEKKEGDFTTMLRRMNARLHSSVMTVALIALVTVFQAAIASAQFAPSSAPKSTDFDGDGRTEATLYDSGINLWFTYNFASKKLNEVWFGQGRQTVPGDYDGDGKTDFAVCSDQKNGDKIWYIIASSTNTKRDVHWGSTGDVPVQGDYDGDGLTDFAVFRPSENVWHIQRSSDQKVMAHQFGLIKDRPAQADYDGNGTTDIAVFRQNESMLYWLNTDSETTSNAMNWASELRDGDVILPADYDGDKIADFATYAPATGEWLIFESLTNSYRYTRFGQGYYETAQVNDPASQIPPSLKYPDLPMPGDYDGDGRADLAVFNRLMLEVHVLASRDGHLISEPMGSQNASPVSTSLVGQ
jgi:hypothetical protein